MRPPDTRAGVPPGASASRPAAPAAPAALLVLGATLLLGIGLTACASRTPAAATPSEAYGIEVLLAVPERPHEVLVDLKAEGLLVSEIPRARERLLADAAATGGDAVILYVHEGNDAAPPPPTYTRIQITGRQRAPQTAQPRPGVVHARVIVWKDGAARDGGANDGG
jgi:hypothetical protein